MLRSGFLLGVGGPAAILTMLVLPSVRASADRLAVNATVSTAPAQAPTQYLPGARPVSLAISPVHSDKASAAPRGQARPAPVVIGPSAGDKEMPRPRRITREGCETPLSSLVGPEARRMVPGRCMV